MNEYKSKIDKFKKQNPDYFDKDKDLKSINTVEEEDNPNYWKRSKKEDPEEQGNMDELLKAAEKDWIIKNVKKFYFSAKI